MKKFLVILLVLFFSNSFSQVENSTRKIDIKPPKTSVNIPPVINKNPNSFTFKKIEKKKDEKGFMIADNEYFLNPGETYLKRLNKEKEKNPNNYTGDAYLGDVKTISETANIVCRDFEYVDGDRVSIMVNDEIVVQNLTLNSSFRGINLKLKEGFNKIDFIALNQGDSGPNTAELRIYDDNDVLISSNQWNLATGAKATLIIVKQ
ncbi:MAG: hypothetical protein ACJ0O5_02595 [Flavobacteriaceae bacterium]|jgi:hypothetical protein|tara:strand:+ start:3915 stop:4529 length:615 start_codon:yes stop_codon:yes gene_type:complete